MTPTRRRSPKALLPAIVAATVLAMLLLGDAGGAPASPGGTTARPSSPGLPQTGSWFGAFVGIKDHTGTTRREAWENTEALIGRKFALDRTYRFWDSETFIGEDDEWSRDQGRTLVLSWQAQQSDRKTFTQWADIADGRYDALIDQHAEELKAFGAPVYFIWDHEPSRWVTTEHFSGAGSQQDFVRSFRHIRDRFELDGVTNVTYVLTLMSITYQQGRANAYYPGDDYVDVLGADGYNWFGCGGVEEPRWRSFEDLFRVFHDYGVRKGKPMLVPEFASHEDFADPNAKANWLRDAAATVKRWPDVKGVLYFHSGEQGFPDIGCWWYIDSSPQALAAFAEIGTDPYFNPPLPGAQPIVRITSGPESPTGETSASFTYESDPGASFLCSLDFRAPEPCSTQGITYLGLADGGHFFSVQAIDNGGGGDASTWYWRVDLLPTAVITSGPPELTAKTKATFVFEADQPVSFTCRLASDPPERCASPVVYEGLARSSHVFSVRATDEFGNVGAAASWRWTVAEIGAAVTVGNFGFDPNRARIYQGDAVRWTVSGSFDHTVTDASGMGLFDSGRLSPGSAYTFPFAAAAAYPYRCALHAQETGTVGVRLEAPGSAVVGVPFTVTWAFSSPPKGYVFDVQVKLPGSTSWSPWLPGTTELDGDYTATAPGTYAFRSRIRRPQNHASSNWSRPEKVEVGTGAADR